MSSGFDSIALVSDLKPVAGSGQNIFSMPAGLQTDANTSQADFVTTLKNTGIEMVQSIENAEAVSVAGLKGEADTYEVVSSIMQAEQSLRMAVAVRDKIISAYLEISRMQI